MAPENTRYDVFISYPHTQKTMADAVCATLEQNRIRCWIAPRDVLPGEPFAKAIIRAMNESRLFVLVFSAETNDSTHVKNEVERAVSKGLSIIVFRVEDVVPTDEMEYYLSRRHWLDAMTPPVETHFQKLIEAVRALLAIPTLQAAPAESEQKVAGLRLRARDAADQANWDQAIALLEQADAISPDDPKITEMLQSVKRDQHLAELRRHAQECLASRDWAGAISALEEAVQLAPDDADLAARLNRAQRSQHVGELTTQAQRMAEKQDWQGVLAVLKQARELAPEDPDVRRLVARATQEQRISDLQARAKAAYSARQWEQALPLLEELRTLAPQDAAAREMLAAATREEARHRQLITLISRAEETTNRADNAARTGQWEAAERAWQDAAYDWGTAVTALEDRLAAAPQDTVWQERLTEAQRGQKVAAQQASRLRSLAQRYSEAQASLSAARPAQAAPLLAAIVDEMPTYRDAADLLRRTRRGMTTRRFTHSRALWLGAGGFVLVVVAAVILSLVLRGASSERVTLQQALANQSVDVLIRGTGEAFGDCITARLTRRTRDDLPLELAQGTLLLSKDPMIQDMVVMRVRGIFDKDGGLTPTDTIDIADDSPHDYLLEAYGVDSRLEDPKVSSAFTVSGPATQAVQRTLQAAASLNADDATRPSSAAIQMALWLLANNQNRDILCARVACRQKDMVSADQILIQAGFGPTPTASPSFTPLPTDTATPTRQPSATAAPSATATSAATAIATATRRLTTPTARPATATRAPAPPSAGTLAPLSPAEGQIFAGRSSKIRLAWSPAARPLTAQEYYVVTLFFPHESETWTDYQWARAPEVTAPDYLYDNVTGDRSFRWQVALVRLDSGEPTGNPQGKATLIAAPGAPRTFKWLPEDSGGGGEGGAAPTSTPRPEATATPRP